MLEVLEQISHTKILLWLVVAALAIWAAYSILKNDFVEYENRSKVKVGVVLCVIAWTVFIYFDGRSSYAAHYVGLFDRENCTGTEFDRNKQCIRWKEKIEKLDPGYFKNEEPEVSF